MGIDWHFVNTIADDGLIGVGVVVLVVRQFVWRTAEGGRMLRLPLVITAVGLGYLVAGLITGSSWVAADWLLAVELIAVTGTGVAMGYVTTIRSVSDPAGGPVVVRYRLTRWGIGLWAVFVVLRIGSFVLADHLGAALLGTTGAVLLSFGLARLASTVVVRQRVASGDWRAAPGLEAVSVG